MAGNDELIAALNRERDGYLRYDRTDRADEVASVLAALGSPVAQPKTARPTRHRRPLTGPQAREKER